MKSTNPILYSIARSSLIGMIVCSVASAATISVNFTSGDSKSALLPDDVAGAPGADTELAGWNNVPGQNGTTTDLLYADGTPSSVSVAVSGAPGHGSWNLPHDPVDANDRFWKGYIDFSTGGSVEVSGLSVTGVYDVYVYFDGSNETNIWRVATFTIGSTSLSGEDSENTNWGSGQNTGKVYQLPLPGSEGANQTWPAAATNNEGNYVVFRGVSGDAFTLLASGTGTGDGNLRAPLTGIQIVQVPEPSALVLGSLGVLGLLSRRKRSA